MFSVQKYKGLEPKVFVQRHFFATMSTFSRRNQHVKTKSHRIKFTNDTNRNNRIS